MSGAKRLLEQAHETLPWQQEWDSEPSDGSAVQNFIDLASPRTIIAAFADYEAAVDALDDHLHQRDCDQPMFGHSRCERCASLHDPRCRTKNPTEPHETRWCDGNPDAATIAAARAALRRLRGTE